MWLRWRRVGAFRDYLLNNFTVVEWHDYVSLEHWTVEPEGMGNMITFLKENMV